MPRPVKAPKLYTKELASLVHIQRVAQVDGRMTDEELTRLVAALGVVNMTLQTAQGKPETRPRGK